MIFGTIDHYLYPGGMYMQTSELNLSMFKSYDIRTPASKLPLELSRRLAHAVAVYFADVLGTRKVVLCRDARLSGPAYLEQGAEIFKSLGFEVFVNFQVSSTCQFYYACMQHFDAAGIMYGASHNPGTDTGQKIVGPGLQSIAAGCGPLGGLYAVRQSFIDGKQLHEQPGGKIHVLNCTDAYIDYSLKLSGLEAGELNGLRIAADFLCGASGEEMLTAFDFCGASVHGRNIIPDGRFPAGEPNPIISKSIMPLVEELTSGSYDLGIAFDGDGDRLELFTSRGTQFSPVFNASILMDELLKLNEPQSPSSLDPSFYVCLKSSPYAVAHIAASGVRTSIIKTGHSHIKEALTRNRSRGFIGAVEESCHYYMHFPLDIQDLSGRAAATENTLFFTLLTAKMYCKYPERYAEGAGVQEAAFREREWGYLFTEEASRNHVLEAVEKELSSRGFASMRTMEDGTDLEAVLMRRNLPFAIDAQTVMPDDWVQVTQRISQTEDGVARWEVIAGNPEIKDETASIINSIVTSSGKAERYHI